MKEAGVHNIGPCSIGGRRISLQAAYDIASITGQSEKTIWQAVEESWADCAMTLAVDLAEQFKPGAHWIFRDIIHKCDAHE